MKVSEICAGDILYDGKSGVRQVLSIGKDDAGIDRVEYGILAAKMEMAYEPISGRVKTIIGTTSSCHLPSLATWAKKKLKGSELDEVLLSLQAEKIKLSPKESVLMTEFVDEIGGDFSMLKTGLNISLNDTDIRAAKGLAKKGVVVVDNDHSVSFTEMGIELLKIIMGY